MHGVELLHRWLAGTCPQIHLARIGAVVKVVDGFLGGGKPALSRLGRNLRKGCCPILVTDAGFVVPGFARSSAWGGTG